MPTELPNKYYLAHARELFTYVENACHELLGPAHRAYLNGFKHLSDDAQCLLIRMIARKPRFFNQDAFDYPEIGNLDAAVAELTTAEFSGPPRKQDWQNFVQVLTKPQLLACLDHQAVRVKAATPKSELVSLVQAVCDPHVQKKVGHRWLGRRQQAVVDYLLFLYFGDLNNRFQKFAMRDLGVLATRRTEAEATARFTSLAEAEQAFQFHQLRRDYSLNPVAVLELAEQAVLSLTPLSAECEKVRDKLILQITQDIYPGEPERAIALWQHSNHDTALEKWVRASYQHACRDSLRKQLDNLRQAPLSATSKLFVEDFYQRKYLGKRTSIYTDMLRESNRVLAIDECFLGNVEEGVIQRYCQRGAQAWFSENTLWRALFGFTLWPILFGKERSHHNEFDAFPAALRDPNFYSQHQSKIEECLALLDNQQAARAEFTRLAATQYGTPTGLFRWSSALLDLVVPCLSYAPPGALAKLVRSMAKDYANCHCGYPDIMIVENESLRFEEIKAPGDVLRPNQLLGIQRLRQAGFSVDICQTQWATDPEQVYAVVDIETTGGQRSGNAITEIAVVRVKNQQIISEWSSLVNPDRPIPHHITRLTGITNQMVATAPRFAEIATLVDEQLDQAIFVAHNVGFDYGFIKSAYEAIGRRFKKPKYCTVQKARKALPGMRSYSLSKLTAELDIELQSAHRALDDARATAELLILIQLIN